MIVLGKLRIFYTLDLLAERFDEWGGSGFASVRVVGCFETAEDEHDGRHVLDAVVAVGEVVHGFELFVDNADAGFVGSAGDFLDVFGGFAFVC